MTGVKDELRANLVEAHQELVALLDSMTPAEMDRLSPNEGWTAKDTLAHLSTIEIRMRGQVQTVLAGLPFPRDNVNDFNEAQVAERKDWTVGQLRDELEREHGLTLALLEGLSEEALAREFDHPRRGRIPLAGIFPIIPNHMRTHSADIAATKG